MANSLQEQLLKAGLTDENKVNKAKKAKQRKEKEQRHSKQRVEDETKRLAKQAQAAAAERDRELNRQKNKAANQQAIQAQIRQLIEMNRISTEEGEHNYNFTDGSKIQRVYVSEQQLSLLSRGRLAIAKLDSRYEIVPAGVAEKISLRTDDVVIVNNTTEKTENEDDPYAEYKVPDDLMW